MTVTATAPAPISGRYFAADVICISKDDSVLLRDVGYSMMDSSDESDAESFDYSKFSSLFLPSFLFHL